MPKKNWTSMRLPQSSGDELTTVHVRRAVEGDALSLGWVTERFTSLLYVLASRKMGRQLRSYVDPEDLVNEVWLIALPRLASLTPRDGRRTPVILKYLSTTMMNVVNRHIEKEIRRQEARGDRGTNAPPKDLLEALPDSSTKVISRVVRKESSSLLRKALEELDPTDQEVILLRGVQQVSNKMAADVLQIDPGAVAVRYHRALQKLRNKVPGSIFEDLIDEE